MPRKGKGQAPAVAPGQPYGMAGEQRAAMQAIPLPDAAVAQVPVADSVAPQLAPEAELARGAGNGAPPMPPPGVMPLPGAPDPNDPAGMDALMAALQMEPPSPDMALGGPSARADEPLTAGLPFGPGATSTSLDVGRGQDGAVSQVLQTIVDAAGDSPALRAMLEDARLRGV